jgi:PAS domain S-box-containing protein
MVLYQDVTEQLMARRELEENEQRFRFMLNAMPQQVWTANLNGALDYVNNNVINDFGQDQDEIVGQGWQAFIHPDDLPNTLKQWQHALETGTEYQVEFRLKFKDGGYRWHLARALPMIEDGRIKLWLGTNTDIDQQKLNE